MAPLQTSLIWAVYAIVVAVLVTIASVFIYTYQTPRDRSSAVTFTCIIAITSLLATVLLLPVDVALISSTTFPALGQRKAWATQEEVDKIVSLLTVVYYLLYSLDAFLCLLAIPFVYFWYEEYDEAAIEAGEQSAPKRLWAAFKYTLSFIAIVIVLFIVGFLVPVPTAKDSKDPGYLRKLLAENRGERVLTFTLGLLITLGLFLYVLYTSTGLALLPMRMIRVAPSISDWKATTAAQLESNQERQRQLEGRCRGDPGLLSSNERRELDTLIRDERTLIRRQRLAQETHGEVKSRLMRTWLVVTAFFRPFKLLGGIALLLIALMIWISMLLTAIDKANNSLCKQRCGYVLGHISGFNPLNWAFVQSAKVFPVDYVIFAILVLLLFGSSVVGISTIGIRFLWVRIFRIRQGHTSPQALLLTTAMLILAILALDYSIPMFIAPQYATFGPQTFCDRSPSPLGKQLDCLNNRHLVKPCSDSTNNVAAKQVCTSSVTSRFLNRVTISYPFFGMVFFWSQFVFLVIYLLIFITSLVRHPKLDQRLLDQEAEEAEEERLLANSGRYVDAN
ncbi:membrane receptor [Aspergillus sclerotioniger CBS 115572]|uniref:Probable lysosomal cobalamin transporter n=1 Tax=Aspergillus sclerotioniger CBS 115572 TaxID=1450535 RepID=A0A317VKT7_9EURO|nr:membrane receptor [Aspergillus sclerotioniger CBS 115572]PWY72540.1 membrane receptor [Aspergillus sclerotioniger CBS 115572]